MFLDKFQYPLGIGVPFGGGTNLVGVGVIQGMSVCVDDKNGEV